MDDTVEKVNLPTNELRLETIQDILQKAHMCKYTQNGSKLTELLKLLWGHIETGLNKFDDQLLCSICFYTVLELSDEIEYYLQNLSQLISQELDLRKNYIWMESMSVTSFNSHEQNTRTLQVVSLMYGMLQSTFVTSSAGKVNMLSDTVKLTLDLLIAMAYEYSRYTFIVFKTISSLKKVCGTELQDIALDSSNIVRLLNLVNHNWENPITGVRDLNKSIFHTLVSMFDEKMREVVLKEINDFYWNKAKYLMLSEIIEQSKAKLVTLVQKEDWICGLIDSLYKPGLVSAGADMYYAIVKNFTTEQEWCDIFRDRVLKILNGRNHKAIQNFSNYWCLATFKKFPDLSQVLIDELEKFEKTESQLFSILCILKQANKMGISHKRFDTDDSIAENMVFDRIQHHYPHIRMLQFEITSVCQGKTLPSSIVYKLILEYLYNNVNSDCIVLRISMLGNIKSFLTYLHASYCNHTKKHHDIETQNLLNFYLRFQEFLVQSLNLDGNYQRKITTIKMCGILLSSLSEIPKKRQKQTTSSGVAMTKFLKQQNCLILFEENFLLKLFSLLKDPADDIRDSTVQLLLDHYSQEISPILLNYLIEDAQDRIRSKFFYEISCGQSIFRLITSLLLKEHYTDTIFRTVNDVFQFAYGVLEKENVVKRDIVKSIEDGKQLHAYLSILLEVLKVAEGNSFELKDLRTNIPQLLKILNDISNQFAWEQPGISSDFSKMSDKVKSIIASSGFNPLDKNDVTKISGLEQIVLNCLWLNVKASCDLASYMTRFFKEDEEISSCEKCLTIITHVLETSRHKGAIEAAGAALGRAVQYLTSLPDESALAKLPLALLKSKLGELISQANMASVTRRGAGLSIMVHRIVSSDMKKGKPLFHHFMGTLLRVCSAPASPAVPAGQRDEPCAVYIHFLTRVVTDSGLASDVMYYSAGLAEVAFDNLTSTHWQIRNAALQLYGALIPKLIGQKKAAGDGTVATVAVDELRTHSPKLWRHILHCLRDLDHTNRVEAHSNVVPILNVLANLARRYNFQSDKTVHSEKELLQSLVSLLGSPIYTVRRLTAKCIFNVFDFEIVYDVIMKLEIESENCLHGSLLLVGHYKEYMSDSQKFSKLKNKFSDRMDRGNHSYFSKREFEDQWRVNVMDVEDVVEEAKRNRYSPGVFYWANSRLKLYIRFRHWDDMPRILQTLLREDDYEYYCDFFLTKMESDSGVEEKILAQLGEILMAFNNKCKSCVVWKILYQISTRTDIGDIIDTETIFNYLETTGVTYRTRYILPFLASIAAKITEKHLLSLSSMIFSLCDPDTSDVDMRYIASLANNEIAKAFPKLPDSIRISAIKSAVLLLQDEDEDVRMLNIKFYSNIHESNKLLHPYVCWTNILESNYLKSVLDNPETGIPIIYNELTEVVANYAKSDQTDEYNPFANDSKNIYFEAEVVRKQLQKLKDNIE